jgi:NADH-quinone oxidoreductase subunit L
MTVPLIVLALLTFLAGWAVGVPAAAGTRFERFLAPVFPSLEAESSGLVTLMLALVSVVVVGAGIILAWILYVARPVRPELIGHPRTPLHALLLNAYYVDALYDRVIVRPLFALATFLARVDLSVIDGAVNAIGNTLVAWARSLRYLETGYVVNYALTMIVGAVALIGFLLTR